MKRIEIFENGVYLTFEIAQNISLLHFGTVPYHEDAHAPAADHGCDDPSLRYVFSDFSDTSDRLGRMLVITQAHTSGTITAITHFRFFTGIPVVRKWTVFTNIGEVSDRIECDPPLTLPTDLGSALENAGAQPLYIENKQTRSAFFVMSEGEVIRTAELAAGESIMTDCAVVGAVKADGGLTPFDNAAAALVRLHRIERRKTPDNQRLPVMFSGGAEGSPESGYPIIDAAASVGCEHCCIETEAAPVLGYIRSKGMTAGKAKGLMLSDSAAAAFSAPEETVVRCFLSPRQSAAEIVSCMIGAMLKRIELCGELAELNDECRQLVKEALTVYRRLRKDIPVAVPFFPTGLPQPDDEWRSYALRTDSCIYVAVQRKRNVGAPEMLSMPIGCIKEKNAKLECIYPTCGFGSFEFDAETGALSVAMTGKYTAGLFKITYDNTR